MIDIALLTTNISERMQILTVEQAALMMQVHPNTIRFWARNGILPDRRLPKTRRFWFYQSDFVKQPETQAA